LPSSTDGRTCIALVLIDNAAQTETHERNFVMAQSSAKESPSIPIVDLTEGDLESVKRIKEACSTTGFFFLAGHGLEEDLVEQILDGARDFFLLEQELKDEFRAKEDQPCGYKSKITKTRDAEGRQVSLRREQMKFCRQSYLTDAKAFMNKTYHADKKRASVEKEEAEEESFGPQIEGWLEKAGTTEEWRARVADYFQRMSGLAKTIRHLIAQSLDLKPDYFDRLYHTHVELMDINYYHGQKSDLDLDAGLHPQSLGCKNAHKDYGMLTFLMDQSPGCCVQVCKNRHGGCTEWIDVRPLENHLIVNIGDMLERWTDGKYVSNHHRVCNVSNDQDKLSIGFFTDPNIASKLFDECF